MGRGPMVKLAVNCSHFVECHPWYVTRNLVSYTKANIETTAVYRRLSVGLHV